jgi:excisionase family DNA binding protein
MKPKEFTIQPEVAEKSRQPLATVPEVAAFMNMSRAKIYSLMEQGELRFLKIGKSRRLYWEDVEELLKRSLVAG